MKFISKLYFNIFKRVGNLRLMFVISCLFCLISLFNVSSNSLNRVYYYNVHTSLTPSEIHTLSSAIDGLTRFSKDDLETVFQLLSKSACEQGDIARAKQIYLLSDDCEKLYEFYKGRSKVKIYSFSYLWNYLWVIFWFYFPFILIFPMKFIIDGYKQDNAINKNKKEKKHDKK